MAKTTLTPSDMTHFFAGREFPYPLFGGQATVAVGEVTGRIADRPGIIRGIDASRHVAGNAGTTTVQVRVNGVVACHVDIPTATAIDTPVTATIDPPVPFKQGDVLDINVSAVEGGAPAGLSASVRAVETFDN